MTRTVYPPTATRNRSLPAPDAVPSPETVALDKASRPATPFYGGLMTYFGRLRP